MKILKSAMMPTLIVLATILAGFSCGSNGGSNPPPGGDFPFNTAIQYDTGIYPAVAGVENTNVVVEMHNDPDHEILYYHVGTVDADNCTMNWGPSQTNYLDGINPSISVSDGAIVAEVHSGTANSTNGNEADGSIWTTIGIANVESNFIAWGSSQQIDSNAYYPSIAISRDSGIAVVVYQDNNKDGHETTLYYRVGTVDVVNQTINWGPRNGFTGGWQPSIAMNDRGDIVSVHNSWQENESLWYEVGALNTTNLTVSWGPTITFDSAELGAKVAISNYHDGGGIGPSGSQLITVFPSRKNDNTFWMDLAVGPNMTDRTIAWNGLGRAYDSGGSQGIAIVYRGVMLEAHDNGYGGVLAKLWYKLGC